jgi:hypothetical protein
MWPQEAVDRLERARAATQQGRYVSVELALTALKDGADLEAVPARPEHAEATLVQQLLSEIRALREAVERQNALIEEQGQRLAALEAPPAEAEISSEPDVKQETAQNPEEPVSWWRRLLGG